MLTVLAAGVVNGMVVPVVAVDADAVVPVVPTGVLTVEADSVVNVVGAVVLSGKYTNNCNSLEINFICVLVQYGNVLKLTDK